MLREIVDVYGESVIHINTSLSMVVASFKKREHQCLTKNVHGGYNLHAVIKIEIKEPLVTD